MTRIFGSLLYGLSRHVAEAIAIDPVSRPIEGRVRPPGSKSITNRALVCAALAEGTSLLRGALVSEDTRAMAVGLSQLGVQVAEQGAEGTRLEVVGCAGQLPAREADIDVGNSGTTVRFLTALATIGKGITRLHGTDRMHQRPIQDLLDALSELGGQAQSEFGNECPPVVVKADGLPGGKCRIRGDISSQFLSGLLLVAPAATTPVHLEVEGPLVSQPYVRMTLEVMRAFGVTPDYAREPHLYANFTFPTGLKYVGRTYEVEPDATAASYFFAAAAITGGRVTVAGLDQSSLQGDLGFCQVLQQMGCEVEYGDAEVTVTGGALQGVDVDMNHISDTVQTLAAVALFADGPTRVRGVAHNRHKETDRIVDLCTELRRLGAEATEHADGLSLRPPEQLRPARIETYQDHRMAMSLALVGLRAPGVVILDPGCTAKTYPKFFTDLDRLVSG